MNVNTDHGHLPVREDIHKQDLAHEMRAWLEGKEIRQAITVLTPRVHESMTRFIKFGKPPLQEDLIMWIASRCELRWSEGHSSQLKFGGLPEPTMPEKKGNALSMSAPGPSSSTSTNGNPVTRSMETMKSMASEANPYPKTVEAYSKLAASQAKEYEHASHHHFRADQKVGVSERKEEELLGSGSNGQITMEDGLAIDTMALGEGHDRLTAQEMAIKAEILARKEHSTHKMTRELIGKQSNSLKAMKQGRMVKTTDHYLYAAAIDKARRSVESKMDERRKAVAIAKTRRDHRAAIIRARKAQLAEDTRGWFKDATEELLSLQKIANDIDDDVRKQRNKAHRATQKVMWTMAPPGYANLRGKSQPGPHLGPGPLPPDALYSERDPDVEAYMKKYDWDEHGRKLLRPKEKWEDKSTGEIVAHAMETIRKVSRTLMKNKLDLKAVFNSFDKSGDGYLTMPEMADSFNQLGVRLTADGIKALFHHFDPNDSGSVHYGEFLWAFFNKRDLARTFRRASRNMTPKEIQLRFRKADFNGNGYLSKKEFKAFLKSFGIIFKEESEFQVLMDRFDTDKDGEIDLEEFKVFINEEVNTLKANGLGVLPSPPKAKNQAESLLHRYTRPQTAPSISMSNSKGHSESELVEINIQGKSAQSKGNKHFDDLLNMPLKGDESGNVGDEASWTVNALKRQADAENKIGKNLYKP